MTIETKLEDLGLTLPSPITPRGNFELVMVHAGLAQIAGHGPRRPLHTRLRAERRVVNGFSDLIMNCGVTQGETLARPPDRDPRHCTCRSSWTRSLPWTRSDRHWLALGAMEAVVHGPGEGERHDAGPAQIVIKATGEDTDGSFFLSESILAPGFAGPPPHRHQKLHDMFYVLEGTLTLRLGEDTRTAGAGSFVCVPPGVVHTFRNDSDAPVRLLNFNTPAGWEHYMRDVAAAAQQDPLTPEVIGRVASRYNFESVDQPG